jgi:hypothetical protein
MRRVVGTLGICIAASIMWGNLHAQTPETTPETKPETETQQDEQGPPQIAEEVRQRLHEPITLKLDRIPLVDALNEILRKRNFDYWIEEDQLQEESIALDSIEVTCDLKHVSIRAALKRILGGARLGWICEDAGIRITTKSKQINTFSARIYDVHELLETPEVEVTTPAMPHQEIQFGSGGTVADAKPVEKPAEGAAAPNGYVCAGHGGAATTREKLTPEMTLIRAIEGSVGGLPDTPWLEADGEGGAIYMVQTSRAKLLVVRAHELCHAEVEDLLNDLISHHHAAGEESEGAAPAEKNASRKIVSPRVRIVAKHRSR